MHVDHGSSVSRLGMWRRALRGIGLAALAGVAVALPAHADDAVKISAFQGTFVNFPVYVAQDLKLFEKHGVKSELVYGKGIQVTNIMVSGAADFGAFAVEHGVQVVSKGQDVKLLVLNQTQPPFSIVVGKDVPIPHAKGSVTDRIKDLKGLKIGITTVGASTDLTLRFLLLSAGLDPQADVKILPLGEPTTQVAGLKNGVVDALLAVEPAQTEAVYGLKIAKPLMDIEAGEGPDVYQQYAYNGIFCRPDYLQAHPQTAKGVVAAIVEAEEMINDPAKIDEVMKVVARNMRGLDQGLLKTYVQHYHAIWAPVATQKAIENVNKVLLGAKQITQQVSFDKLVAKDYMPTSFSAKKMN